LRALGARPDPKTGRYRAPSDTTFFRVLNGLDAAEFDLRIGQWMMAQEISILQALAVDGKCLRGSARTDGKPLQLLSAVSHRLRLTVAQEPIEQKSNEIPALQPLLRKLPPAALEGSLITADALDCQQESARFITQELGADYLFGLKGNQSGVLERAQIKLPQEFFSPGICHRLEQRAWAAGTLASATGQPQSRRGRPMRLLAVHRRVAGAPVTAPGQGHRTIRRIQLLLHQRRPQAI